MNELLTLIENQPDNIDARMELAKIYLNNHDYENAASLLEEVTALESDHLDANHILGQLYEFNQDFHKAAVCFEKLMKHDPSPNLKFKLAQLYENADEYDKALELYREYHQSNPDDDDVCERIAHVNRILGNNAEAIEFYNSLLRKNPDNIVALTQLMELYEGNNSLFFYLIKAKINELEGTLSHAISSYKKALLEAEKQEEIIQIRFAMADIYIKKGNFLQAVDEYLAIMELDNRNYLVYKSLGNAYAHLENMEAASESYEKALVINSDDKAVYEELADIYLSIELYDKATVLLEKLAKMEPDNLSFRINLAKAYIASKIDDKAKEELDFVYKKDSKNAENIGVMVDFLILKKDYENALKHAEEIKQIIPKSPFGYRKAGEVCEILGKSFESHYNFGIYHDLKGEKQLAIDEFTWALEQDYTNLQVILKLAKLYEEISEEYIALEYYQKACKIDNNDVFILQKTADIYTKKKDYEQAIGIYKKILSVDENNKEVYVNLGNAYECVKNYDLALENYKKYIDLNPYSSQAEEIKEKIEKLESKINGEDSEGLLGKILGFFSK